jgi:hypothetical protein
MGGVSKGLRGDGGDGTGAISRRLRGTEEGIQIAGDGSTLQGQRALGRPLQGISCCLSETVTRERTRTSRQRASKEAADSAFVPPFSPSRFVPLRFLFWDWPLNALDDLLFNITLTGVSPSALLPHGSAHVRFLEGVQDVSVRCTARAWTWAALLIDSPARRNSWSPPLSSPRPLCHVQGAPTPAREYRLWARPAIGCREPDTAGSALRDIGISRSFPGTVLILPAPKIPGLPRSRAGHLNLALISAMEEGLSQRNGIPTSYMCTPILMAAEG